MSADVIGFFYGQLAVLTALCVVLQIGRPRNVGQWAGLMLIAVAWPLAFAYALYWLVRRGFA